MAASGEETAARLAHSLHAHFLKAGTSAHGVDYTVTTLTEGRSFATRRIDGQQSGELIFTMTASFHCEEPGFSHRLEPPFALDVVAALAALEQWSAKNPQAASTPVLDRLKNRPIEIVPLDPGSLFGTRAREPRTGSWMRLRAAATGDAALQRAVLAYASDMMFLRNAMLPHGVRPWNGSVQAASLDHAVWFHETPDFSRWHLFATGSPWAGHARGLNTGHFFREDGTLVATVTQESLMRPVGEARERSSAGDDAAASAGLAQLERNT